MGHLAYADAGQAEGAQVAAGAAVHKVAVAQAGGASVAGLPAQFPLGGGALVVGCPGRRDGLLTHAEAQVLDMVDGLVEESGDVVVVEARPARHGMERVILDRPEG